MSTIVSAIIPTFNDARYLAEAVASLRRAARTVALEVLIIDDGTTDPGSLKELSRIAERDCDVQLIKKQNGGLAAARNTGLDRATGQFIQFLDADDVLIEGKIDHQVEVLESGSHDAAIGAYIFGNAELSDWWHPVEDMFPAEFTPEEFVRSWEVTLSIPIHTALFRAQALSDLRFDATLPAKEDWVFWARFAASDPHVVFAPQQPCVVYRHRDSSMTGDRRGMAAAWLLAFKRLQWVWEPFGDAEVRQILELFWDRYDLRQPFVMTAGSQSRSAR